MFSVLVPILGLHFLQWCELGIAIDRECHRLEDQTLECSRLPRCRGQVVSEVSTAWPYLSRGFRAHLLQGSGVGHEAVPAGQ